MCDRCEMEKEQRCQSCCTDGHERTGRRRRREDSRMMSLDGEGLKVRPAGLAFSVLYSKRHNKFLFPALAGAIYGSTCKAKNEIFNVVNYRVFWFGAVLRCSRRQGGGRSGCGW